MDTDTVAVGTVVGPVEIGPVASGGHWVARLDSRVIFVRHALASELVTVRLTDVSHRSWWAGDVETVLRPSPYRVVPPCPVAGRCGGCDFQHVELAHQRVLKAQVIAEQLCRLAQLEWPVEVEPVPGDEAGLGWRTRMRYAFDAQRFGLRAHASNDIVALPESGCPLASPQLPGPITLRQLSGEATSGEVTVAGDADQVSVWVDDRCCAGTKTLRHRVAGRDYRVSGAGFWQVHPGAAQALSEAVQTAVAPQPGEVALDLYCGAGLFAGALAGAGCRVLGVETDRRAVAAALRNVPEAEFVRDHTERALRGQEAADIVVLDPPRRGAGKRVVTEIARLAPRVVAYVSCDPAALARDVAYFAAVGYRMDTLRCFDVFPMTQHVECVARFVSYAGR